jgi:hypothetical protein
MPKFTGISMPSPQGKSPLDMQFLGALKENVEVLTGQRGDKARSSAAVLRENVTPSNPPEQKFKGLTATGAGVKIAEAQVPTYTDYAKALTDIQTLSADLANLRTYVTQLVTALRG